MPDMVVNPSDNSSSGSNNSPWGGSSGNAGRHNSGRSGSNGITTLKSGDSYQTPWGIVKISTAGHPTMNGVVMTKANSSMVENPSGGYTRVLNSLIGRPTPVKKSTEKSATQTTVENYLAGGSWAGPGPVDTSLINTAIVDALTSQMQGKPVPITENKTYKLLRGSFDSLPFSDQPSAHEQISKALNKFHDSMPDKVKSTYETGGKNGHTIVGTKDNPWKKKLSQVTPLLNSDLNNAIKINKEAQIKNTLSGTVGLIADVGEKVSKFAGEKFMKISQDISSSLQNFQGKKIRGLDDAIKTLNKVMNNPGLKFSQEDKNVLANAWKHVNAESMAKKMATLSKAFNSLDAVRKILKVKEKCIDGYTTGNWQPLLLEVESWVHSGMFASVAVSLLASVVSVVSLSLPVTASILTIAGIMLIAYLSSLIDDKFADRLNNEIIPSAQ